MKIRDLLKEWQQNASYRLTARSYEMPLALHDAARIEALAEMYPGRTEAQIISELLGAALDELEGSFPYVQGNQVVAEDDQGDPIYEDEGLTPQFYELTQKHSRRLAQELESPQ